MVEWLLYGGLTVDTSLTNSALIPVSNYRKQSPQYGHVLYILALDRQAVIFQELIPLKIWLRVRS